MVNVRIIFGLFSGFIAFFSYGFYFRALMRRTAAPSSTTWLTWSFLTGVTFFAQVNSGGGAGTGATGISALCCLVVALWAIRREALFISKFDVYCLLLGFVGIGLWHSTRNPLFAVVTVSAVHVIGFLPTFYKSYNYPYTEVASTYYLTVLKYLLALPALQSHSLVNVLYPLVLIIDNGAFVLMLGCRKYTQNRNSL